MVDSPKGLKHVHHVKLMIMLERRERLELESISLFYLVQSVLSWKNFTYRPLTYMRTTDLIVKSWAGVSAAHYDSLHSYQKPKASK
jgi:hypothetical protein